MKMDTYLCKCIIFSDYRREFSDDDKKPNDHQSAAADSLLEINTNLNKETALPPPHSAPPPSSTHFPSSSFRSTIDILKGKMTICNRSVNLGSSDQTDLLFSGNGPSRQICRTGPARLDRPKPDHQKVLLGLDSASGSISPHCCDNSHFTNRNLKKKPAIYPVRPLKVRKMLNIPSITNVLKVWNDWKYAVWHSNQRWWNWCKKNRRFIKTSLHSLTWYSKRKESTCLASENKLNRLSSRKVKKIWPRKTRRISRNPFHINVKSNTACVTIFLVSKCHLSMIFKITKIVINRVTLFYICTHL